MPFRQWRSRPASVSFAAASLSTTRRSTRRARNSTSCTHTSACPSGLLVADPPRSALLEECRDALSSIWRSECFREGAAFDGKPGAKRLLQCREDSAACKSNGARTSRRDLLRDLDRGLERCARQIGRASCRERV